MSRDQLKGHNARISPRGEKARSIRELTRNYNHMLLSLDKNGVGFADQINGYTCPLGHVTYTIDRDNGVTPYMTQCEHTDSGLKCPNYAQSMMYRNHLSVNTPTHEWYRPNLVELLKLRNKPNSREMLEHVLNGGLMLRKIEDGKG